MTIIYKYNLEIKDIQSLMIQKDGKILTCQTQNGEIVLWVMVDNSKELEERFFEIFGTGNPIHEDMGVSRKYIDTVQENGFVWHIFERLN